jgi:hypothetical protein
MAGKYCGINQVSINSKLGVTLTSLAKAQSQIGDWIVAGSEALISYPTPGRADD